MDIKYYIHFSRRQENRKVPWDFFKPLEMKHCELKQIFGWMQDHMHVHQCTNIIQATKDL